MANGTVLDRVAAQRRQAATPGAVPAPSIPPPGGGAPLSGPQESLGGGETALDRVAAERRRAAGLTSDVTPSGAPAQPQRSGAAETLLAARPAFLATGSMVGGAIGATAGPAAPAAIVGGAAMGTMAANAAFNITLDVARAAGVKGLPPPRSALDRLDENVREGFIDAAFGLGIPALGQVARGGRAALLRAGGATQEMIDEARRAHGLFGVDLAPSNFDDFRLARFFSQVLGKLPFIRGPLARNFLAQGQQLGEAGEYLFARVGPTTQLADLGMEMNMIVDRRFATFRRYMNHLYNRARRLAQGTFIPTDHFRAGAEDLRDVLVAKFGDLSKGKNPSRVPVRFLREVERLVRENPTTVPFDKFDGLSITLEEMFNVAKKDGLSVTRLAQFDTQYMKTAMVDLWRPVAGDVANRPLVRATDAREAFEYADGTYAKLVTEFQSPTAKRFQTIEKRRFEIGLPEAGTRNPDEAMNIVFNKSGEESPQAMRDLRTLLHRTRDTPTLATRRDSAFNRAARGQLDKAWSKALKESELNLEKGLADSSFTVEAFRRQLGLNAPQSTRYAATREMLRTTGVPIERLNEFTSLIAKVAKSAPDDINVFLGRRVAIGGARGLINALVPGAVVAGAGGAGAATGATASGLIAGLITVATMRHMANIVSDPRTFNIVTGLYSSVLDDTLKFAQRRAAAIGIFRILEGPGATEAAAGPQ